MPPAKSTSNKGSEYFLKSRGSAAESSFFEIESRLPSASLISSIRASQKSSGSYLDLRSFFLFFTFTPASYLEIKNRSVSSKVDPPPPGWGQEGWCHLGSLLSLRRTHFFQLKVRGERKEGRKDQCKREQCVWYGEESTNKIHREFKIAETSSSSSFPSQSSHSTKSSSPRSSGSTRTEILFLVSLLV